MLREFHVVFRHHYMEPLLRIIDLNELQDLQVVLVDIIGESERAHIDHIDIGILD